MTSEPWVTWWDAQAADCAAAESVRAERERRTLAELLLARGESTAAALVAIADYRTDMVDNWNGGMYKVYLAMQPGQFDPIDDLTRSVIEIAARDIIGANHFAGLAIEVRLAEINPGWDERLLKRSRCNHTSPVASRIALPAGGSDAES
jgi:hypothetical protein